MPSQDALLFDPDDLPRRPPDGSLTIRQAPARPLSKEERAFNRAVARIQALRGRLQEEKRRLDQALSFQARELRPRVERATAMRTNLVRLLALFLDDRRLKPAQRKGLRRILQEQLDDVIACVTSPDADLLALFERLHGTGYAEAAQRQLDEARSGMAAIFEEFGVDVEVPDLHPGMSDEELAAAAAQFAEGMRRAEEQEQRDSAPASPRKTKRELREEERARRFEHLRKDNIGAIYRRLVKVLHPDLERDPSERENKSRVMQDVTAAYKRGDLHALLRLELECIDGAGLEAGRLSAEKLRAYTELLKQQASELEAECNQVRFHPRYAPLLVDGPFGTPMLIDGPREAAALDDLIESLRVDVERLRSDEALTVVREALRTYRGAREAEERAVRRRSPPSVPTRDRARPFAAPGGDDRGSYSDSPGTPRTSRQAPRRLPAQWDRRHNDRDTMTDAGTVMEPPPHTTPVTQAQADHVMLEGPHSRRRELFLVLRTVIDFIKGFRALHFVGPCVTIFGSARFDQSHPYYALGRQVGARMSRLGFTVMTGGGPGLMEAANRGAREAGGASVGCNIRLPMEQDANPYLDRYVTCQHFFVRKVLLFKYWYAFIALPGGIGTMDELFEALTLIQTKKIESFPVVLIGTAFWKPYRQLMEHLLSAGTISAQDLELMLITDDLEEAAAHVRRHAIDYFGLTARRKPRPAGWLGERGTRLPVRPGT